ncbi:MULTISPECIES: hypothetical protein [Ralstonia solanacearum species complex]|nr:MULTISPECIES: hypothetical protein [Ralstonia solanacearum species complex]
MPPFKTLKELQGQAPAPDARQSARLAQILGGNYRRVFEAAVG